jgi:hypothetical protein
MAEGPETVNSIVLRREARQNGGMKPNLSVVAGVAVLLLTGCSTSLSIYHREGAVVSRMQNDLLNCEVSALADVPVSTQIRRGPPEYYPGYRVCQNDGRCYYRGGYFFPGEVYTVDGNLGLRKRVLQQCMANQGYSPVTVPNCPNAVRSKVPVAATQVLPQLSEQSCAIRNDDGSWQIVTLQ